jgi:predicted RNase H-like HicB family nuclease
MTLHVFVRNAQGAVQAFCPDLPGCSASAATEQQALLILRGRIGQHFAARARVVPPRTRVVKIEI